MYDYIRDFLHVLFLNDIHNYAYILLVWNFETFGILLTILTYGGGSHKFICTCFQIK